MESNLYIYLAGTIKKDKQDQDLEWSQQEIDLLKECLSPLKVVFLNPAKRSDDLSDQASVFGRDLFQVYSSHVVLVDAREKRGLGVGAEMMFAKMHHIPVISWLPTQSHYQREEIQFLGQSVKDWIHPFIFSLSDYLAPTLQKAAEWIQQHLITSNARIKNAEDLYQCIQYYLDTQLSKDQGMHEIIQSEPYFLEKFNHLERIETCLN